MTRKTLAAGAALAAMIALLAPGALAGSAQSPELTDAAEDCAVPYGNEYLDVVAAWVSDETENEVQVNLQLAKWNEALAEGSGYAVQFTHQGESTGVVAVYVAAEGGWSFFTAKASRDAVEDLRETSGAFTVGPVPLITVTFSKRLLPHEDPHDAMLDGFRAFSADLRPALPFILADDFGTDPNGKWILCDEALGEGAYTFTNGRLSAEPETDESLEATRENNPGEASREGAAAESAGPSPGADGPKATPGPGAAALAALVAAVAALPRPWRPRP